MNIRSNVLIYYKLRVEDAIALPNRFKDWYDFADFLKQEELKGKPFIFVGWKYI